MTGGAEVLAPSKNSRRVSPSKNSRRVSPEDEVTDTGAVQASAPVVEVTPHAIPDGQDKAGAGSPESVPAAEDGKGDDGTDAPTLAELSEKVAALKRKQRASALRGALIVFAPPVVLCVPLVILKACNLLLLSWWWCVSPLVLWLVPVVAILSIFIQSYRLYKRLDKADGTAAGADADKG